MSKRTNLSALLFMLVFLLAMVGTTFAEPLFPAHVGLRWEFSRSDNTGNEWPVQWEIKSQVTYNSVDYFQLQVWNYDNDGAYEDGGYLRSTAEALYGYNPTGNDYLEFQAASVGTKWSFYQEHGGLDYKFIEIVAIEPVTVPYGTFNEAYNHSRYRCENSDGLSGDKSPYWYEWIVPGVGMVKEVDYWTDNPPAIMELVRVTAGLDIDWIGITSTKEFRNGAEDAEPWQFDIWVYVVDPGTLHHIDITKPGDSNPFATMYEGTNPGWWDYDFPNEYSSLSALRAVYLEGTYTLDFYDIGGELIKSVELDYSGIGEPSSPVDFIYPSTNGQTGISVNPTFRWSESSGAGNALLMVVEDDVTGELVYLDVPVSISSTSWKPGSLSAGREYELDVSVINIKDWGGGSAFPTMTDHTGDIFSYSLMIEYMNEIEFTTTPTATPHPADTDSDYVIDDFELLDYIDLWADGQVEDFDLLDAIDLWAAGHY